MDSIHRRTGLEEIAVYIQNKPASFLRFFGFVDAVIASLKSNDLEIVQNCLFLLSKFAEDPILKEEIIEKRGFEYLRECLISPHEVTRILTLAVYEQLSSSESRDLLIEKKEIITLLIYLEEYILSNVIRGIYLIWKIFEHISRVEKVAKYLIYYGCPRLMAMCFEIEPPQKVITSLLVTLKNICKDTDSNRFLYGDNIIFKILYLLETASEVNISHIIEIVSITASQKTNISDGSTQVNSLLLGKVLKLGMHGSNEIRFTVLKVLKFLFDNNSAALQKIDMFNIGALIYIAIIDDDLKIRETGAELLKKVVKNEWISLVEQPDIIAQILINCTLIKSPKIMNESIETIYLMCKSVRYLALLLLSAPYVIEMVKNAILIQHPEITSTTYKNNLLSFDAIDLSKMIETNKVILQEEDIARHHARMLAFRERLEIGRNPMTGRGQDMAITVNTDSNDSTDQNTMTMGYATLNTRLNESLDTDRFAQERSGVFSELTSIEGEDKSFLSDISEVLEKDYLNIQNPEDSLGRDNSQSLLISTTFLVKIMKVMIASDVVFAKAMSYNIPAFFGVLIEKAVGNRYLGLIDAIFSFFSNMFDILLLREGMELVESLKEIASLIANKFLLRVLKVIYKEIGKEFVDWNMLCSTMGLILRIFMKDEVAETLIVCYIY